MNPIKRKILTFFKKPHEVIRKYFRILILREILPLYSNENYDECWGFVSYMNKVVLDLGADYGSTAYYFLKRGAKKVIAVEGDQFYASKLLRNYGMDSRVKCIGKWIGCPGDIEELLRLKQDIVKVDIEGAEIHIAKVCPELLKSVREWVIEVHRREVYDELSELFLRLKFKVFPIDYDLVGVYKILYARRAGTLLRKVSDKALEKFQNPWCLYECDYRNDETCEWTETRNCPYASGKSNWPLEK